MLSELRNCWIGAIIFSGFLGIGEAEDLDPVDKKPSFSFSGSGSVRCFVLTAADVAPKPKARDLDLASQSAQICIFDGDGEVVFGKNQMSVHPNRSNSVHYCLISDDILSCGDGDPKIVARCVFSREEKVGKKLMSNDIHSCVSKFFQNKM